MVGWGDPPIMGLWQGRLPEDHVILQVEKVHLLGVTQRPASFITWVPWAP